MTRTGTRTPIAALLVFFALVAGAARGGELGDDLAARRASVAGRIGTDTMLILLSAPARNFAPDVDYPYRQESNLYYLTGMTQEETALVILPGEGARRAVLFVKAQDPAKEHWFGRVLSAADAAARSGIPDVLTIAEFPSYVDRVLSAHQAARVAMLLPKPAADAAPAPPTPEAEFARRLRERFEGVQTFDVTPMLTAQRVVKTPYERTLLVRSVGISSDAQMVGMRAAGPDAFEYQVKAAIEGAYMGRGADSWAYPSIVGSGPNATILHYPDGDRKMKAGELLLVDAAASVEYMCGDITRTYPVGGRFTEAQKDIYAVVLAAQDAGVAVARAGSSIAAIHARTVEVIKAGLLRLGLITDTGGDQYRMWYTHGASHFIGVDVHDVGDRNAPFVPGMAFTIEPGIYIRQSALDSLPRTPANATLIARVQPAVRKYIDIGVRIEDSFLLEDSGPRRLSGSVPRTVDEIETFLRKKK